jgi:hypothetical protein
MANELLLVGSAPLETAEEVMRLFGAPLGRYLATLPDGEVGDRRYWVLKHSMYLFNGHPELVVLQRPATDDGVERLVPRDRQDMWRFRVADGVDRVRFGDPGWRLGYTKDAINSYFVFRSLRDRGAIPRHLRFQVSLPLVNSVVSPMTFPEPGDIERVRPGYADPLKAEIAKILEKIPHEDLAIQWDCSWEITDMYGGLPGFAKEGALQRNAPQFRALSKDIPEEVMLGYHFCFGTFGGWPRFAPPDLSGAVALANAAASGSGRRVDWLNIPGLDRSDDAFFRPLADLDPRGARVYLGLVHNMDRFAARVAAARKFLPSFSLSAPCGFGRCETAELPGIVKDHLAAMKAVGAKGARTAKRPAKRKAAPSRRGAAKPTKPTKSRAKPKPKPKPRRKPAGRPVRGGRRKR